MIACVVCISFEAAGKEDEAVELEEDKGDTLGMSKAAAGALAICCGLIGAILMSSKHFIIKVFKGNYSGVDQGIDASLIEFFIMSFLLIPLSDKLDIGWKELAIGGIAGVLICTSRICISIGVSLGLAGPAQSLMSTHALH